MSQDAKSELAPTGVLRAAINMWNFLLVTGKSASGDPDGVSPDMARAIADRLGVPVKYVPYKTPGELADAAGTDAWDIGLIGAEPQRAEKIAFTAAYVRDRGDLSGARRLAAARRSPTSTSPACASRSPRAAPTTSGSSATSSTPNWCAPTVSTAPTTSSSATSWTRSPACAPAADGRHQPAVRRPASARDRAGGRQPSPRSCCSTSRTPA